MMLPQSLIGDWQLPDDQFLASFRLPREEDRIDPLAALHPLPREGRLCLDAEAHVYYFEGRPVPRSVTALIKSYCTPFDSKRAAEDLLAAPSWQERRAEYEEEGGPAATADSIVALWSRNGDVQRARGQLLHFQADQLCQGRAVEQPWSPELRQVRAILEALASQGLRPLRSEASLYHAGLRVAGQADLLMTDGASISVLDWKRVRALEFESRFRCLRPPLEHLPDTNYWIYALQVNLYAYMLSSAYGLSVGPCYLGAVHPERSKGRCLAVPDLQAEVAAIVETERAAGRAGPPDAWRGGEGRHGAA